MECYTDVEARNKNITKIMVVEVFLFVMSGFQKIMVVVIFFEWAYENGYKENLTIDRIDVNGNYCPENCRWVDMKVQANNKRNSRYITYKGQTKTLSEWMKEKLQE